MILNYNLRCQVEELIWNSNILDEAFASISDTDIYWWKKHVRKYILLEL